MSAPSGLPGIMIAIVVGVLIFPMIQDWSLWIIIPMCILLIIIAEILAYYITDKWGPK